MTQATPTIKPFIFGTIVNCEAFGENLVHNNVVSTRKKGKCIKLPFNLRTLGK